METIKAAAQPTLRPHINTPYLYAKMVKMPATHDRAVETRGRFASNTANVRRTYFVVLVIQVLG